MSASEAVTFSVIRLLGDNIKWNRIICQWLPSKFEPLRQIGTLLRKLALDQEIGYRDTCMAIACNWFGYIDLNKKQYEVII